MKNFVLVFLIFYSSVSAQSILEGTVYLYKNIGSNVPLDNVYLKAEGAGPYTTKNNGFYSFVFDNTFKAININAFKKGYEIVNTESLKSIDLSKVSKLNIYLDVEGNTQKRENLLIDKGSFALKKRYDNQIEILSQNSSQAKELLENLEKLYDRKFADFFEASSFLANQKDNDKQELTVLVKSVVQENLDHSNARYNQIIKFIEKGEIDSIKNVFSPSDFIEEIGARNDALKKDIASAYLYITAYALPKGLYDSIDITYRGIINADTLDKKNFINASLFFYNNNRLKALNSLLGIHNVDEYKYDSSFHTFLLCLKLGLALKENDALSIAFAVGELRPDQKNLTLTLRQFFIDYNLSGYQKLILIGIFGDLLDRLFEFIPTDKLNEYAKEISLDTTLSNPKKLENYIDSNYGKSNDSLIIVKLETSLLFSVIGNIFYEKKFYKQSSDYYNTTVQILNFLSIQISQSFKLKYKDDFSYNELDSFYLNKFEFKTYIRLISCVSKNDSLKIVDSTIEKAQTLLTKLTSQNAEAYLKEGYEFYRNVGIIKLREHKISSGKIYLQKALSKLNKLELLNASFLNVEEEKQQINKLLLQDQKN